MDTQGLSIICAGLGEQIEDDDGALIGYTKSEYCLDNLKDLQRFLRRDHPMRRDVFKQICKWNTVARDIVPIIEFHQSDRNLVITAVKILVFLTMPIDPASDDVAQQIEYLWGLKAALTRSVTVAVIVSLLEDPLEHLESNSFTEDDWKLIQLVLTLFRNILAIQGITLQQKASGSATQFLSLTDKFLELMFQENVMDLILVLTQHVDDPSGYLQQDSLLFLEIFHHIFEGRDPELIAGACEKGYKADGDMTTSVESLRAIMEEEADRRRSIRQRNLERHSQFSGTFTRFALDGSKTLFKGNPASASGDKLLKSHKAPRGQVKRIAWDHGSLLLLKGNILDLLHNFLNQFLSGGYNVLMQSIRDDIKREHHDIQNVDIITFFQVAQFVIAFQRQKVLLTEKHNMQGSPSEASLDGGFVNLSFRGDFCGPIAATINEAMFYLVIAKWREAFEGLKETNDHKSLSVAASLMKNMMHMLDLVLKLLPEDSKEPQTARILLYKLFYDQTDQGLTHFLLNLFRSFDTHKQPKSYLADLLEVIHLVLQLMDKLQARGTLRVARKSRRGRGTKKGGGVGPDKLRDENHDLQNVADQTSEAEKQTSKPVLDTEKTSGSLFDSSSADQEGSSVPSLALDTDMPSEDVMHQKDNLFSTDGDKENNPNDLTYETEDLSDGDQLPATSEADFNVTRLVSSFANNTVIQNLCWLLKYYKSNSASTNHYIICMLRRFCDDLELSPMLYQLSLLNTFYDILSEQKSCKSKDYENVMHFITKFVRKMMKTVKSQPILFVEMLFWKTRRECRYITAEALMGDLANLKKDIKDLGTERTDLSNSKGGAGYRSIADSLGDDEFDNVVPPIFSSEGEEELPDTIRLENMQKMKHKEHKRSINIFTDEMDEDKSEFISSHLSTQRISPLRHKGSAFDSAQEYAIRQLYVKYKDDRRCSRLIAEALDPDGKISPVQISSKLKQLGLKFSSRKRSMPEGIHIPAGKDTAEVVLDTSATNVTMDSSNEPDDSSYFKTSRQRKRISPFSKEQEAEIKVLFERFKNQKKCSQLIANALGGDNTYTSAQVSRKLRQLGLLAPKAKRSSTDAKLSRDREDPSDEETLEAIAERSKRKNSQPLMLEAMTTGTLQEDTDNETLSTMFKSKRKKSQTLMQEATTTRISQQDSNNETSRTTFTDVLIQQQHELRPAPTDGLEADAFTDLADNIEIEKDSSSLRENVSIDTSHQQYDKAHDELMDFEDSGDDLGTVVPRKVGSRRNLKMVIDAEDDE